MARQEGLIKISGNLDDLSFYRSVWGDIVRRKGGPSRETIRKKRSCQGIRDSNTEFANAASAAKLLRHGVAPLLKHIKPHTLVNRVTSLMLKVKNADTTSVRGARSVAIGMSSLNGKALVNGFDFNEKALLKSVLKLKPLVNTQNNTVQLNNLVTIRDLKAPSGATHVQLCAALLKIDFINMKRELQQSNTVLLPLNNTTSNVTLQMSTPNQVNGQLIYVLQIEFLQEGAYYDLENGLFNACGVVGVMYDSVELQCSRV